MFRRSKHIQINHLSSNLLETFKWCMSMILKKIYGILIFVKITFENLWKRSLQKKKLYLENPLSNFLFVLRLCWAMLSKGLKIWISILWSIMIIKKCMKSYEYVLYWFLSYHFSYLFLFKYQYLLKTNFYPSCTLFLMIE